MYAAATHKKHYWSIRSSLGFRVWLYMWARGDGELNLKPSNWEMTSLPTEPQSPHNSVITEVHINNCDKASFSTFTHESAWNQSAASSNTVTVESLRPGESVLVQGHRQSNQTWLDHMWWKYLYERSTRNEPFQRLYTKSSLTGVIQHV